MDYKKIILGVVIIVILIFLYNWIFKDAGKKTIFGLKDANQEALYASNKIVHSSIFTWSFWVYVKDYTIKFGEKKNILFIGDDNETNLEILLDTQVNNLIINIGGEAENPTRIQVDRFPIQKWTHVLMSHRNRAIDTYIDGKIVDSTILSTIYKKPDPNVGVVFNRKEKQTGTEGKPGYNGFLGTVQYFTRAVQPEEAYAIYKAGYSGGNWFSDLFDKYRLKIAFMEDSKEINSFVL